MTPPTTDTSREAMLREAEMMDASSNHVWAEKTRALAAERDALRAQLAAARNEALEEAKAECETQRVKCNNHGQYEAAAFCKTLLIHIDALKSTTPAPKASDSECPSCGEYDCGECECECDPAPREVTVQEAAKAVTFEEWLEACPDDDTETNRDRARRVLGPRYGPWLREAWRLGMAQVEASDYYKTGALCALAKEEQSDG